MGSDAGTIVKKVRTEYQTDGLLKGAIEARRKRRELKRLGREIRMVKGHLASMGKTALMLGGIGGAAGVVGLVKKIVGIGAAAEDAELALTGLLQKNSQLFDGSFKSFSSARSAAKGLRREFRRLAKASPVTAGAIQGAFTSSTTELSRAGVDLKGQVELARSIAVADLSNPQKGTAGRDVAQLLRGRAGANIINTPALVGGVGKEIAKLAKKGKFKKAVAKINEALTPSPELLKAYENSFTGITATAKDELTKMYETAAKPLMMFLVGQVKELNKWMGKNRSQVRHIAQSIGRGIVKGLRAAVSLVRNMVQYWDFIVVGAKTFTVVYLSKMVAGMGLLGARAKGFAGAMGLAYASAKAAVAVLDKAHQNKMKRRAIERAANIVRYKKSFSQMSLREKAEFALTGVRPTVGKKLSASEKAVMSKVTGRSFEHDSILHYGKNLTPEQRKHLKNRAKYGERGAGILKGNQILLDALQQKREMDEALKGGFGGGKSPRDAKVGRMQVRRLEVPTEDLARIASPIVRRTIRELRNDRPLSASLGLGSALPVANGVY